MDLAAHAQAIADAYQPPPGAGRPSLLGDAQAIEELLTAVEAGNYLETACQLADISHDTVRNWLKRGEAEEGPHRQFLVALKRAQARAEALAVANVRAAGRKPQFWAAEMKFLERRHPERWGRRTDESSSPRVIVQGAIASDVQVQVAVLPSEHNRQLSDTNNQRIPAIIPETLDLRPTLTTTYEQPKAAKSVKRQAKVYDRRHPPRRRARRANPAGGPAGAVGSSRSGNGSRQMAELGVERKVGNREIVPENAVGSPYGDGE